MNTIKQNVNVEFIRADVKDVAKLLPVMNQLAEDINHNKSYDKLQLLPEEERSEYKHLYKRDSYICYDYIEYLYDFLVKCGLASAIDILPEGSPLIKKDN